MKCLIISSVTIKSAITPFFNGLMALIFPGVLPSMVFASSPTARTDFFPLLSTTATTDGSLSTTPCPFSTTSVLAVPRSIAISWLHIFVTVSKIFIYIPFIFSVFKFCFTSNLSGAKFLFLLIIILFNALM